jgi:uncharacterized repeat protein (TIGR01451 family)
VGNGIVATVVTSSTSGNNCPAGGLDPQCATAVTLQRLSIALAWSAATTTPGATLELTATFTNTGKTPYSGVVVNSLADDLGDDATLNGQTVSSGTIVIGATGYWTGDIPVGGVVTAVASFTVLNPDTGNKRVTIADASDAPGSSCPTGAEPGCSATSVVLTPGLTIVNAADTPATVPGGTVAYTATITNSGETPQTGVTVTDTIAGVLDDAAYNADVAASTGSVSYASPTFTWTGSLDPGEVATVTWTVTEPVTFSV